MAIVSQLCISFPYVLHGLCEDYLTCDIAFNAVMPLSRASTHGRYSRIEGVTFTSYKSLSRLVLCYKKDWATLLHFIYFCYLLLVTIYPITKLLLPLISVLAENTLLKTAYHFLLLLVGFDTLTYRKDYDRSPTLVGHQSTPPL